MSMCTAYDFPHLANIWSNTTSNPIAEEAYYEQFEYADIVVSHCPPSGKLGRLGDSKHIQNNGKNIDIGSKELRKYIEKYQPRAVIVGHNHRSGGAEEMIGNTRVINVATTFKYIEI
jgi:Icc-related predicted phosphoesterase